MVGEETPKKREWRPSKFEMSGGRWRASRNPNEIIWGSQALGDVQVLAYKEMLDEHAAGKLIDLGCGSAPLYGIYRSLTNEAVLVDWENGVHNQFCVDIFWDLNKRLPFDDDSFDTVLATDVLEHVINIDLLISEMIRICKRHGKILVGVPFLYPLHEEPFDFNRFTEHALRTKFDAAGATVINLRPYCGGLEGMFFLLMRLLSSRRLLIRSLDLARRALFSIGRVRRFSDRTLRSFPVGYCLVAVKDDRVF